MDGECKLIDLNQIATVEELIRRREDICSRYNDFVGELAKRRSHLQEALRLVKWGASFRWSFDPNSAWSSIETMTIGKTHPSLC